MSICFELLSQHIHTWNILLRLGSEHADLVACMLYQTLEVNRILGLVAKGTNVGLRDLRRNYRMIVH